MTNQTTILDLRYQVYLHILHNTLTYRHQTRTEGRSLEADGGTDINSAVVTAINQLCGDNSGLCGSDHSPI